MQRKLPSTWGSWDQRTPTNARKTPKRKTDYCRGPKIIQILESANKDVDISMINTAYLGEMKQPQGTKKKCRAQRSTDNNAEAELRAPYRSSAGTAKARVPSTIMQARYQSFLYDYENIVLCYLLEISFSLQHLGPQSTAPPQRNRY